MSRPQVIESIGEPCSQSFTRFVAFWHGESLPPVGWQGLQSAVWAGYEAAMLSELVHVETKPIFFWIRVLEKKKVLS